MKNNVYFYMKLSLEKRKTFLNIVDNLYMKITIFKNMYCVFLDFLFQSAYNIDTNPLFIMRC